MSLEIVLPLILLVAFIVEVVLTETENFIWGTAFLLLCGGLCYYFNIYGAALWVKAHVAQTLLLLSIYLVAGIVWSFIKWFGYLIGYREKWHEAKENDNKILPELVKFAKREVKEHNEKRAKREFEGFGTGPAINIDDTPEAWEEYARNQYSYRLTARNFSKPLASNNKAKIIAWISFWPFSFLGTFINDPVRRFFNFIFSNLKKTYQKMSDHLFKDLEPKNSKENENN